MSLLYKVKQLISFVLDVFSNLCGLAQETIVSQILQGVWAAGPGP